MVILSGPDPICGQLLRTWSSNPLSSGEAEYCSGVEAASVGLGMEAWLVDLGVQDMGGIVLKISARMGIGKHRHVEVNQLWL